MIFFKIFSFTLEQKLTKDLEDVYVAGTIFKYKGKALINDDDKRAYDDEDASTNFLPLNLAAIVEAQQLQWSSQCCAVHSQ